MSTDASAVSSGEMKRSLTLTGVTVNAMALIAPGAFLWTTFQVQSALTRRQVRSTAADMWPGLLFSLILALLTAYSYAELARIYPDAGTGSSYYFAEAAFLEKESPAHRKWARFAKLSVGWISHLYYWIYPGIMVAFTATLFGYIYSALFHHTLTYIPIADRVRGVRVRRRLHRLPRHQRLDDGRDRHQRHPDRDAGGGERAGSSSTASATPTPGTRSSTPAHVVIPHSFINVLYQSTIAILLLVGFESVTALGAEAINPEKDIKQGVLLSLLIQGGICYLFEYFAANFVVGKATRSRAGAGKSLVTGYDGGGGRLGADRHDAETPRSARAASACR